MIGAVEVIKGFHLHLHSLWDFHCLRCKDSLWERLREAERDRWGERYTAAKGEREIDV